jgi:hypothetical protein
MHHLCSFSAGDLRGAGGFRIIETEKKIWKKVASQLALRIDRKLPDKSDSAFFFSLVSF